MIKKEDLMSKIQNQRRFLDDLLLDIAAMQVLTQVKPTPHQEEPESDKLMTAKEVMEYLGIKPSTFYEWIKKGIIPAGEDFGGCSKSKRWRLSTIIAALEGNKNDNSVNET